MKISMYEYIHAYANIYIHTQIYIYISVNIIPEIIIKSVCTLGSYQNEKQLSYHTN